MTDETDLDERVARAVDALSHGAVALVSTDTVLGLAQCVEACPEGAGALFELKQRDPGKPVAWLVGGVDALDTYAIDVPVWAHDLARRYWPGPLTLVVSASSAVPAAYKAPDGTIALRMPASRTALLLIERLGSPLATTSANTSGAAAPKTRDQVESRIAAGVGAELTDEAPCSGLASTVVVCTGDVPVITRVGSISEEDVMSTLHDSQNPDNGTAGTCAADQLKEQQEGLSSFYLPSSDGLTILNCKMWLPQDGAKPRGVVQLVHGMAEHIGRYDAFARFLTSHGFAVVGHDHIGHGGSAREGEQPQNRWGVLGHGADAEHLVTDVHVVRQYAQERFGDVPYVVFGHSMGSFVVRAYLIEHAGGLAGAIVCGTGWQEKPALAVARAVAKVSGTLRGWDHKSNTLNALTLGPYAQPFKGERDARIAWLSRDEEVRRAYDDDPACGFTFSAGAFHELYRLIDMAEDAKRASNIPNELPVLIISGEKDPVGGMGMAARRVEQMLRACGLSNIEVHVYPGARHELLNETNRDEVMGDIASWLDRIEVAS